MIVIKLIGEKYDKNKLQENSVKIRKWFAMECINKNEIKGKYHEISENNDIENQYENNYLCIIT